MNSLRRNGNIKIKIYCPIIQGLELNWLLCEGISKSHWVSINKVVAFADIIGTNWFIYQELYFQVGPAMRVLFMTLSWESEYITSRVAWLNLNLHSFFYLINWSIVPQDLIASVRDWFDWSIVEFEHRARQWDFDIFWSICSRFVFSSLCVSK